tara:strand:+ start:11 stop:325 length:315 start_codon:yes stop_codon:yes gene_type:complete
MERLIDKMLTEILLLTILYVIFSWTTSWIRYFNNLDERFGDTIWRWSYDYPVKGKRDISDLDDTNFVQLRRKRNRAVTIMYWIFFLSFIIFMSFISKVLFIILN